jgi:hypothetical protein
MVNKAHLGADPSSMPSAGSMPPPIGEFRKPPPGFVKAVALAAIAVFVVPHVIGALLVWECDTNADPCDSKYTIAYSLPVVLFLAISIAGRTWRTFQIALVIAFLTLPFALWAQFIG